MRPGYWTAPAEGHVLARGVFLRALALVYAAAFGSLALQWRGLVGERGIVPAAPWLDALRDRVSFFELPTVFWLSASDGALVGAAVVGALLSVALFVGFAPRWVLWAQWCLYLSLVQVGGVFLRYQWDALLLETGLLAALAAPGGLWPERHGGAAPRRWQVALLWFLTFRLMVMAGLVKLLSGDPAWRDLTALQYHYWTQPLPTWTAYYAALLPAWFQRASVLAMLCIEVGAPFLIFFRGRPRWIAGALLAWLQLLILLTGNYGYFNYLALTLCLPLLDDRVWRRALPKRAVDYLSRAGAAPSAPKAVEWTGLAAGAFLFAAALWMTVGIWIRPDAPGPVRWVLERIDPFQSVHAYGLFAVMTTTRPEIVVEGSLDGRTWTPYEFRYKPGALGRRPVFVAPLQPRLDWQMWFAALGSCAQNEWFLLFQKRLLEAEPAVLDLLARDPFQGLPPKFVRAELYQYRFASWQEHRQTGAWWTRTPVGPYCPTLTLREGELTGAGP